MKRYNNLWSQITDFKNIFQAARQAQRGKRFRDNVLEFNYNLESELIAIQEELTLKTYLPGEYSTFQIVEPKKRMISAAPYRDRVVHHSLCNIIMPIFERSFIYDSYANRLGFGTHKALRRFTGFLRSSRYVFQADIQKYFPSIDHAILKDLVRQKIKCKDTLWLIDKIIDGSNEQESANYYFAGDDLFTPYERRRGLPIGNLTSQFFANLYLNNFDHFVKENLKATKYLRYVDDFAIFSNDKYYLEQARLKISEFLSTLRLKIHPIKSQIFETKHGATFLGFRVFPNHIRVKSENLRRARRRLRGLQEAFSNGEITFYQLSQSICSWIAHLEHGDTWRLREQIFDKLIFVQDKKLINTTN